jgi:hypothetical protein
MEVFLENGYNVEVLAPKTGSVIDVASKKGDSIGMYSVFRFHLSSFSLLVSLSFTSFNLSCPSTSPLICLSPSLFFCEKSVFKARDYNSSYIVIMEPHIAKLLGNFEDSSFFNAPSPSLLSSPATLLLLLLSFTYFYLYFPCSFSFPFSFSLFLLFLPLLLLLLLFLFIEKSVFSFSFPFPFSFSFSFFCEKSVFKPPSPSSPFYLLNF